MAVLDVMTENRVRNAVNYLSRFGEVRSAYLFGSHVKGKPDQFSDIDVAVFIEGVEKWGIQRRAKTAAAAQKEFGDDLEIHFFSIENLLNPHPASFAAYIFKNGEKIELS